MNEKEEMVEVTVKIPKKLMQFLEDMKFFGWDRELFFTTSVSALTSAEMNELDIDVLKQLEEKYRIEASSFVRMDPILPHERRL